jgi:secondary thiamine-phosphate synthase enzyme
MKTQKIIEVQTKGKGLYSFTSKIIEGLNLPETGILNCFLQHTSASLVIQENADPTAKADLEEFVNRLIPDSDDWYSHTLEGADDSTSHLKAAILPTSLNIPICNGKLGLGTWQGIYVWEHRHAPHRRRVIVTVL